MGRGQPSPAPTRRGSSAMGRSAGGADHEMVPLGWEDLVIR